MPLTIIQLSPDAWQQYRALRLTATKTDQKAFGASYEQELERSEQEWRDFIGNMWFATVDNRVVGMIGLVRDTGAFASHRAQVISFWVDPVCRGQGIGRKLIEHVQEVARRMGIRKLYLHVTATQDTAIRLYETLGFVKVGHLKDHVQYDGSYFDQIIMEW
jgi:ribosomal protein S18 acetylase RimI-like enzyme